MIRRAPRQLSNRSGLTGRSSLTAVALCLGLAAGAVPLRAEETAISFIRTLGDTAIRELSADGITVKQREAKFRELFKRNFDVPRITRFALGRYARRVSKIELREFSVLYEDLAVLTYAGLFAAFGGRGFTVTKQLGAAGDKYVMVVSKVAEPDGALATRLDWQVLVRNSGFLVVDIRVEGVSMVIAQRDEYTAFLDKNKGDMSELLTELASKVRKLREDREIE